MQYTFAKAIVSALLVLGLAACAAKVEQTQEEVTAVTQQVVEKPVQEEAPEPVTQVVVEKPVPAAPTREETLLKIRTFYFDYDKAELRQIAIDALNAHADSVLDRLRDNPSLRIVVEGHTDSRGTISYNNALGNKRAEAVARYLRVRGVPASNLEVVSYGELRPLIDEENEAAWQRNRRSVLVY